jgi:hypothetical protein
MLDTFQVLNNKDNNIKMLYSPFISGNVGRKTDDYIFEHHFIKNNPFGKPNNIGIAGKLGGEPKPIFGNVFCGMIVEKDWLLKIDNMFPQAFSEAGGYIAESLLLCVSTWMFGGKCYIQPNAVIHHPVYRLHQGLRRNQHMHWSMAICSYICGGDKYLENIGVQWGGYEPKLLEDIKKNPYIQNAREYVAHNAKYSLEELMKNWETIRNG